MRDSIKTRNIFSNSFYSLLMAVAAITIILYLFILSPFSHMVSAIYKKIMIYLLSIMGIKTLSIGYNSFIAYKLGGHAITIILSSSCIGIYSVAVYVLLVLFTPKINNKYKIKGLAVGVFILSLANVVRIMTSGVLGVLHGYASFRFFHDVVGGALMVLLVATLWVDWVYRTSIHSRWP